MIKNLTKQFAVPIKLQLIIKVHNDNSIAAPTDCPDIVLGVLLRTHLQTKRAKFLTRIASSSSFRGAQAIGIVRPPREV